jgi:hypothetical protein
MLGVARSRGKAPGGRRILPRNGRDRGLQPEVRSGRRSQRPEALRPGDALIGVLSTSPSSTLAVVALLLPECASQVLDLDPFQFCGLGVVRAAGGVDGISVTA